MKLALSIGGQQIPLPGDVQNISNKAGSSPFAANIFTLIINVLLFGAAIVAFLFIIYGGIKWITSEGDSKNIETARNTIINAVIGLFIAFFAMFIINILGQFFQAPLLGPR